MRSFDLVDFKAAEADFFLKKLANEAIDPIIVGFYFSAYVSAARSITFCLQAVLNDLSGFDAWYKLRQDALKKDGLAKFFVEARNLSQKVGVVPIETGAMDRIEDGQIRIRHFFAHNHPDFKDLPNLDVAQSCKENLRSLLKIVYDCYIDFGTEIDPHQHYTKANYERLNLSIDDVDEELMGVRGWTYVEGWPEEYRWQMHRNQIPGCRIGPLFEEYLGLIKPGPPQLPETLEDFDGVSWVPPCLEKKRT